METCGSFESECGLADGLFELQIELVASDALVGHVRAFVLKEEASEVFRIIVAEVHAEFGKLGFGQVHVEVVACADPVIELKVAAVS